MNHPVKSRSIVLWLIIGGALLTAAFAFSSYFAVNQIMTKVDTDMESFVKSGNLAVLDISGVIMESREILKNIRELKDKKSIKAVVVRINSPGGAVGSSQEIYDALKRLRKDKKVVCSFGDVAASGGYYIAAACEKIVSDPGTLTGSIGVIMHFINLKDLYAWAKVEPFIIKAGKYKDIGSEMRRPTEDERLLLQTMIDQVHNQFKSAVREGRKLSQQVVDSYADGRILSGEQAKNLGFVDVLGGEFEAIQLAADLAGIEGEPKVIRQSDKKSKWTELFEQESASEGVVNAVLNRFLPMGLNNQVKNQAKLLPGVPYYLPSYFLGSK